MDSFLSFDMLNTYATFVSIVFMVVEFTKEMSIVKKIPTKHWSFIVSFVLLIVVNFAKGTFRVLDIVLYILNAMSISLGSNGLSEYNTK